MLFTSYEAFDSFYKMLFTSSKMLLICYVMLFTSCLTLFTYNFIDVFIFQVVVYIYRVDVCIFLDATDI